MFYTFRQRRKQKTGVIPPQWRCRGARSALRRPRSAPRQGAAGMVCSLRAFQSTPSSRTRPVTSGVTSTRTCALRPTLMSALVGTRRAVMRFFTSGRVAGQGHGAYHRKHRELHQPRGSEPRDDERSHRPGGKPDADKAHRQRLHDDERDEQYQPDREEIVNAIMCLPAFLPRPCNAAVVAAAPRTVYGRTRGRVSGRPSPQKPCGLLAVPFGFLLALIVPYLSKD